MLKRFIIVVSFAVTLFIGCVTGIAFAVSSNTTVAQFRIYQKITDSSGINGTSGNAISLDSTCDSGDTIITGTVETNFPQQVRESYSFDGDSDGKLDTHRMVLQLFATGSYNAQATSTCLDS